MDLSKSLSAQRNLIARRPENAIQIEGSVMSMPVGREGVWPARSERGHEAR